ncbi:MAG: Ig-like domain-containing protein [candidate division KSB1 bacterium]|nr:Ig-like domain-containing protein [candidate division KSB1 bacterium]MDZ7366148.1 Ig-like domain-containing protein [candidate division KSB1 bacterium]MDZ7404210.1 Ig-like domain-containing protein [candidate division KSB1 bacterium]
MRFFCLLAVLMFLPACARQLPPPGGPEDRTPPQILSAAPQPNATRVSRSARPQFIFSEKVDHTSFEQAFFVSPTPSGEKKTRFRWRGKQVEIVFPDSLDAARTYVITIGTDVRDLRGNRFENALTLAFSTGDSIDTGEIHGKIFHDKRAGVLIMAYVLSAELPQPNPGRDAAAYLTQAGEKGDFSLSHLSDGRYRIFALEDRSGDRLYQHGEEPIGVPSRDVVLSPAHRVHRDLNLRLALADTIQPRLTSVSASDQTHLEMNFDEEVAPLDSLWERHLHIVSAAGEPLKVFAAAAHPLDAKKFYALTAPQQAVTYDLSFDQIADAAGNPLDSLSRRTQFSGSARPDTIRPRLVKITPADSSRNVPVTSSLELIFSEMMANSPGLINFSQKKIAAPAWPLAMLDSTGKAVKGKGVWLNPFQFRFQPDSLLKSRAQYFAKISADSAFDPSGNAIFDTLKQITFWTMNADTLTAISGKLADAQPDATGTVHLSLKQVGAFRSSSLGAAPAASRSGPEYSLRLAAPGPYRFDHILPGLYQLSAFRDANNNGRYDYGAAFPFVPAERFMVWPDTMQVRPRWPNEGNDFVIP